MPPTQQSPSFLLRSRRACLLRSRCRAYSESQPHPTNLSLMSMEESSIPLTVNSVIDESNEVNLEINKQIDTAGQERQENAEEKEEEGFQTKKRKFFSEVWNDFDTVDGSKKAKYPTQKMLAVEFCFPKLYSELDASKHISKVKEIINSLYEEYVVEETNKGVPHLPESESFGSSSVRRSQQNSVYNWDDFDEYYAKVETSETKKSELIAADILAIPVSSVASEAIFSAGTRVIDSYRSSLSPDTVQTLLCGGDWLRHIHGLKKKTKLKLIKKFFFQYLPLKKFDMEFWKHMLNKEEDMEIAAEF
ncbi:hypothetical protein ZIOFF_026371 [Zingiber officinale]|uniref:HAT C-terminal dimerisation domain-containing protein n=1 Tax=Zingiber officinale TaxID=94328 RepID=A0A8J5L7E1_ZINOF|nr:hypothetical protein ZIOFF_026371 [Zingiber officinale]